jgi:hypothetical protein
MSVAPATAPPASTAAATEATSPETATRNYPEQMLRARSSFTDPAFSIVSSTRNPVATLDNSISPIELISGTD